MGLCESLPKTVGIPKELRFTPNLIFVLDSTEARSRWEGGDSLVIFIERSEGEILKVRDAPDKVKTANQSHTDEAQ